MEALILGTPRHYKLDQFTTTANPTPKTQNERHEELVRVLTSLPFECFAR